MGHCMKLIQSFKVTPFFHILILPGWFWNNLKMQMVWRQPFDLGSCQCRVAGLAWTAGAGAVDLCSWQVCGSLHIVSQLSVHVTMWPQYSSSVLDNRLTFLAPSYVFADAHTCGCVYDCGCETMPDMAVQLCLIKHKKSRLFRQY